MRNFKMELKVTEATLVNIGTTLGEFYFLAHYFEKGCIQDISVVDVRKTYLLYIQDKLDKFGALRKTKQFIEYAADFKKNYDNFWKWLEFAGLTTKEMDDYQWFEDECGNHVYGTQNGVTGEGWAFSIDP